MIFRALFSTRLRLISIVAVFVTLTALADASSNALKSEGERISLNISAVGDVMMGSAFPVAVLPPNDGISLFEGVKDYLRGDIVFGNLEGPLVDGGEPQKCRRNGVTHQNCYEFSMPARYAQHLVNAGFNVMNIANNHFYDFGERGVSCTFDTLTRAGIKAAGCGRVARFDIKGRSVAVIGFTFSPFSSEWGSLLDIEKAKRIIRFVKSQNQTVIVSFHGGAEGRNALRVTGRKEIFAGEDRGNVREFARGAVEAGADVVIGHGPHVLRAMEVYRNKLIAYSLGNFLTYGMFNLKGPNGIGAILQVKIDNETGDFLSGRIVPVLLLQGGLPFLDPEKGAVNLVKSLTLEDFGNKAIGIGENGELYTIR
jgi:poly-gamma-glutamate capsule biosynthesis protein CapA/YwtB (metallophosphatase superfamily)